MKLGSIIHVKSYLGTIGDCVIETLTMYPITVANSDRGEWYVGVECSSSVKRYLCVRFKGKKGVDCLITLEKRYSISQ